MATQRSIDKQVASSLSPLLQVRHTKLIQESKERQTLPLTSPEPDELVGFLCADCRKDTHCFSLCRLASNHEKLDYTPSPALNPSSPFLAMSPFASSHLPPSFPPLFLSVCQPAESRRDEGISILEGAEVETFSPISFHAHTFLMKSQLGSFFETTTHHFVAVKSVTCA